MDMISNVPNVVKIKKYDNGAIEVLGVNDEALRLTEVSIKAKQDELLAKQEAQAQEQAILEAKRIEAYKEERAKAAAELKAAKAARVQERAKVKAQEKAAQEAQEQERAKLKAEAEAKKTAEAIALREAQEKEAARIVAQEKAEKDAQAQEKAKVAAAAQLAKEAQAQEKARLAAEAQFAKEAQAQEKARVKAEEKAAKENKVQEKTPPAKNTGAVTVAVTGAGVVVGANVESQKKKRRLRKKQE